MNERVSSLLVKGLNYDFEFKENTLNEEDRSLETDLYNITIFGNNHVIAMGNVLTHPEQNDLLYNNVYLIYSEKVVSKLGIYEMIEEDEEKQKTMTHRNIDFSALTLLVDNHYYEQPHILESFIQSLEVLPQKKALKTATEEGKEGELEGKAEEEDDEKSEEEDAGKSEGKDKEEDAGTSEEKEEKELKDVLKQKCADVEKTPSSKHYSSLRLRNILVLYHKTIANKHMKAHKKKTRDDIKESMKTWFHESTKDFVPTQANELTEDSITPTVLLLMEYFLNIKCIVVDENSSIPHFSVLGALNDIESLVDHDKAKENELFKNYNPGEILYITKTNDKYHYVDLKSLDTLSSKALSSEEKSQIKEAYEKKDHEYVFETQLVRLKEVVS